MLKWLKIGILLWMLIPVALCLFMILLTTIVIFGIF